MNEIKKKKHFSIAGALKFWDNFDVELYARILKEKNENDTLNTLHGFKKEAGKRYFEFSAK